MAFLNLDEDGAAVVKHCLPEDLVAELSRELDAGSPNRRDGFLFPAIVTLASSESIRKHISETLGYECFAVRAVLFNKNPEQNRKVSWHQDGFIGVRRRADISGWGPWSIKLGVSHVRPPANVLAGMLTIRIHLDECYVNNGPLRILPATHKLGVLSDAEIDALPKDNEVTVSVDRGDAILMRPLIVQASSPAILPKARRVIHIEYAGKALPDGLEWNYQVGATP